MDDWEKFNETSLSGKEYFRIHLNMEDITDADHTKRVLIVIVIIMLLEYCDLYVQSDRLLLVGVFENIRNVCFEIYELDLAHFLTTSRLAW